MISSNRGSNVLHLSASRSTDGEMMKFLLEHVVDIRALELVNAKDILGYTLLHYCSSSSHSICLKNAEMLVQAGATITIKGYLRQTPYDLARDRQMNELAKYLWCKLSPEQQALEKPPP
ncbi:hypothetical protein EV426DRAFT_603107, partial [Tirmania nivea]